MNNFWDRFWDGFWDGFWGAFRHPVTVYCIGFTSGAVMCELLKLFK